MNRGLMIFRYRLLMYMSDNNKLKFCGRKNEYIIYIHGIGYASELGLGNLGEM